MNKMHRFTPHYLQPSDPKLVSTTRGIVGGVLLSSTGNASLTLYDAATATNMALADRKVVIVKDRLDSPVPWDVPLDFTTGLCISMAGTGARATIALKQTT